MAAPPEGNVGLAIRQLVSEYDTTMEHLEQIEDKLHAHLKANYPGVYSCVWKWTDEMALLDTKLLLDAVEREEQMG
jgi:hypothetical protein